MEDYVPFGTRLYALMFLLLLISRGMDLLSTRVATPTLMLEGNPIAKKLGWNWGLILNFAMCVGFACWPVSAIVISTMSVLVAARNFQSAWLMRSLGEESYRDWHVARIQETPITLYLFCLAGNTLLTAGVGGAVIYFSHVDVVPMAIGMGIIGYAVAVAFFTLLAIWKMRRAAIRDASFAKRRPALTEVNGAPVKREKPDAYYAPPDIQPQAK
jgi:hypothetical protein